MVLVPELALRPARDVYFVAERAVALAIRDGRIDVVVDWKSDINPNGKRSGRLCWAVEGLS
jgi:CRISPR-associated exonuclease Cas4